MNPQQALRYVQVPAEVWSPETQQRYFDRVTAKGRGADGMLSRNGVLQACILVTAPFQSIIERDDTRPLAEDAIWDLRRGESHRCDDRPGLVEGLAEALSWHDLYRGGIDLAIAMLHDEAISGLQSLGRSLIVVQRLRRKNKLRGKPALRALSSKKLRQAYRALATVVKALTVDDYAEYGQVDQHLTRLLRSLDRERDARMRVAFQHSGPSDAVYGQEAVNYCLAVILNQLGLEVGATWYDIAERLRKRSERAQAQEWRTIADRLPTPHDPG
jgi:hypothetical protein